MNASVHQFKSSLGETRIIEGTIALAAGERFLVDTEVGRIEAGKAFSCLVMPMIEDRVMLSHSVRGCHVLAILERVGEQSMQLDCPSDLSIRTPAGSLTMSTAADMNLFARGKARMLNGETEIHSASISINTGSLSARSGKIEAHAEEARYIAGRVELIADTVMQKMKTLTRWVDGVETVNLGSLIQKVRGALTSHSRDAVITASKDVRIDGERIHMG